MIFNALPALAILAAVLGANAQDASTSAPPVSVTDLTPCIATCITQSAASNGCPDITDVSCLCTSTAFQQAAASCLQSQCSANDVQAALALQAQQCAAGPSATALTGSGSGTGTGTASNSGATTGQTSNAAAAVLRPTMGGSTGGAVGVGMVLVGAVLGAGLVL
ncbi:hypothetical protein BC628DRAFT_1317841 [Trametes gibbosa]|nr:hypothetical protein BC628DRAFT_1317841 [Trametes gibbosa]